MRENDTDTFTVQYGRVGGTYSTATYPVASWDKKFREKVSKGYLDPMHSYNDKKLAHINEHKSFTARKLQFCTLRSSAFKLFSKINRRP
ncbi:hypothetical protein BH09BAC4_BH09BAC4_14390 [soil metagenome]